MNEVKTTFRRMALYYLLLAVNIIPCGQLIPDVFPMRNLSVIYLLTLCVCHILYYSHRVTPMGGLSFMMKALSAMSLLLILFRGIKYSVFAEIGVIDRHIWYLYYVPMILMPLFLFYISLYVAPKKDFKIKKWLWTAVISAGFIILILTNDLHQLVFSFQPDFERWDSEYSYGILFYIITVWRYILYLSAITILVMKCRITSSKKNAWIIMIPFVIGAVMNTLLVTEKMPKINGTYIIEFPEALIFTAAVVLECCIGLGLIPTNTDYGKLFQKFSIAAQITDKNGDTVYSSLWASPLSKEQFQSESGSRISEHTVLNKMEIPGGFGFWQDDMTELDRLNDELARAKEELLQENELIRLRNKLKEKQTKTEQRSVVYDMIAKRTQKQSQLISEYAKTARTTEDLSIKEESRKRILLLGAYIKRYANLMLLSQEDGYIETGEFALSVSEVLRYLNYCGIPSEFISNAQGIISADTALKTFEIFETLLESNLSVLKGTFVNLSTEELKITLENLNDTISNSTINELKSYGVQTRINSEDGVTYICFTLGKGGEA
ncbi:MAG: hypothetical protein IJR70_02390 [Eubacterium sp.]|nr:hypothetical protein [Eubacterium sp.]